MGLLKTMLGLEPKLIKLITANIKTNEEHHYFVSYSKDHPQLQSPEFVRLILHYYAKILFNFDPRDPGMSQAAAILKNKDQSLLATRIRKDSNILKEADIDDVASIVSFEPKNKARAITATLLFKDMRQRVIPLQYRKNLIPASGNRLTH